MVVTGAVFKDIADAIREKDGSTETMKINQMAQKIRDIPTGGGGREGHSPFDGDVLFYGYRGKIEYAYSESDFLALSEMPPNPTEEGFDSRGWNWTIEEAKSHVQKYHSLQIGQTFVPTDGRTHIKARLEGGRLSPYTSFGVTGTAVVDWGDGATSTISGTSYISTKYATHTYEAGGDYDITIRSNGEFAFEGTNNAVGSTILFGVGSATSDQKNKQYQNRVKEINFFDGVKINMMQFYACRAVETITLSDTLTSLNQYAFDYCGSLKTITIPPRVTSIGAYTFQNCYAIKEVILPKGVTSLGNYAFNNCYCLERITLPEGLQTIGTSAFYGCYALESLIIPSTVTSIGANAFREMAASNIDFSNCEAITPLSGNAFATIPSDLEIIVPDELYDDWIVATNWSNTAIVPHIIKKSQSKKYGGPGL